MSEKSKLLIFGMALDLIGEFPIEKLSDNTKAARLCAKNYELAKNSVLRLNCWSSATKTCLMSNPSESNGLYRYKLPDECIRVCSFGGSEYAIEGREVITSLSSPVKLTYVNSNVNEEDLDPLLMKAISAYLAWTISYSLTGSLSLSQNIYKLYKFILKDALAVNARENSFSSMPNKRSFWIESRD